MHMCTYYIHVNSQLKDLLESGGRSAVFGKWNLPWRTTQAVNISANDTMLIP